MSTLAGGGAGLLARAWAGVTGMFRGRDVWMRHKQLMAKARRGDDDAATPAAALAGARPAAHPSAVSPVQTVASLVGTHCELAELNSFVFS